MQNEKEQKSIFGSITTQIEAKEKLQVLHTSAHKSDCKRKQIAGLNDEI